MPNSLYIHIPFCLSKCHYCSFTSYPGMESIYTRYTNGVVNELEQFQKTRSKTEKITTLFFGGGTPTALGSDRLVVLINKVRALFDFDKDAEITIEANPGTVELKGLVKLREAGCNRLSFGVQTLNDAELKKLGRMHSEKEVYDSYRAARDAGFENISLDLMYGLPDQTLDSWKATLEKALSLMPQHLSMYQLTIEQGTPFYSSLTKGDLRLPEDEIVVQLDQLNVDLCTEAGLNLYEISNYAADGFRCRHNLNYWQNESYLGAGAGAVSYVDGLRARRIGDPERYCHLIEQGLSVIEESEKLAHDDAFRETVIMGLRMVEGVDREALQARFGLDLEKYYGPVLKKLVANGLVELDKHFMRLSNNGRRYANVVMSELV